MLRRIVQTISVRYKMMFAIFLVFVVPVGALLTITNRIMIRDRVDRCIQRYKSSAMTSVDALENLNEELYTMGSRLSQTMWFKNLIYAHEKSELYNGDDSYDLHMYNDQLATYTMINDQFSNIIVYFPERSYIMSSMGLLYQKMLPERLFKVISMNDDEWLTLITTREEKGFSSIQRISVNGNVSEGVLYKFAFPIESTNSLHSSMIVYIRKEKIAALIDDSLLNDTTMLSVWNGDKLLYKCGAKENNTMEIISIEGETFRIEYALPKAIADVHDLEINYLYLLLLSLVSGILLAWTVSYFFYRPLTVILHKIGKAGSEKSGFQVQEYKLIESRISDIVHEEKMLRMCLKLQRPILLNSVFDMMLHERYVPDDELEKLLDLLRVSFSHPYFRVAKLLLQETVDRSAVESIIRSMRGQQIDIYYVWQDSSISLIMNYSEEKVSIDCLVSIIAGISVSCFEFSCGLGETCDDLLLITSSGKQADAAMKQSYMSPVHTLTYWNPEQKYSAVLEPSDNVAEKINALIIAGQPQRAIEMLASAAEKWRLSTADPNTIKLAIKKCYDGLVQSNQGLRTTAGYDMFRPVFINMDLDIARLSNMISIMAKMALDHLEIKRQEHIQRMEVFIEDNLYNPELSLSLLADELGYSVSYISKLFKDMLSCNFLDYVIDRRIEQAKVKLEKTNEPISDIAREVGYNSDTSFRRQFKSKTNITPSAYRLMHFNQNKKDDEKG